MTKLTRRLLLAIGVALLLSAAACGNDSSDTSGSGSGSGSGTSDSSGGSGASAEGPTIKSFEFSNLEVKAGEKVTVTNEDSSPHTFTAKDGSFDAGTIEAGGTAQFTAPSEPGDYEIKCNIHSSMKGTLKVT